MTVLVADNACEYNTLSSVFGDHLDKFFPVPLFLFSLDLVQNLCDSRVQNGRVPNQHFTCSVNIFSTRNVLVPLIYNRLKS